MRGARTIKQLVEHSERSFAAAIDTYNRIGSVSRVEGFVCYMTNAWELLLKARMIQLTENPNIIYTKKIHPNTNRLETKSIDDCIKSVFQSEFDPIRINIERISELRNEAVHYMISELESIYISFFQASALNYVGCLKEWFSIDFNKDYDFPILSLFTLSETNVLDLKVLKGKYDKKIIDFVIEQQRKDIEIKKLNIDNTKAQLFVPVEYKAVIVKNPKQADIIFGRSNDNKTGLCFVETPKDVEKTHPYLQADIKHALSDRFEESVFPTGKFQTYDAKCITMVNHFDSDETYAHYQSKPVLWRYSEKYLNFVIAKITKDRQYLFKMRERFKLMQKKGRK